MSQYFFWNGEYLKDGVPVISPSANAVRYGDGLFETMRFSIPAGSIFLRKYHFDRLSAGAQKLGFILPPYFTLNQLEEKIKELCEKNGHNSLARVRLTLLRPEGDFGSSSQAEPDILIQSYQLSSESFSPEKGLILTICPDVRKSADNYSNLKSNNCLPYLVAARYAQSAGADDAIILNSYNRVCESSIANIFIEEDGVLITPPLTEGCVAGVMRKFLTEQLNSNEFTIREEPIDETRLKKAQAVFLTNAIRGVRWVNNCGTVSYSPGLFRELKTILITSIA